MQKILFASLTASFAEIEKIPALRGCTLDTVKDIVERDEKGRFALEQRPDLDAWYIKANQGHSLSIPELALERITSPPDYAVVHGTFLENLPGILQNGLDRRTRQHIHFAKGEGATSGIRRNCEGKLEFFTSPNGVVLCRGPVGKQYFSRIVNRKDGSIIERIEQ